MIGALRVKKRKKEKMILHLDSTSEFNKVVLFNQGKKTQTNLIQRIDFKISCKTSSKTNKTVSI